MIHTMDVIQEEREKLQKAKETWKAQRIEMGGDPKVIGFISDILFHGTGGVSAEDSIETIRNLFEAGYCYYMANMLKDAFPGGDICLCYPYGHIIYAYEGVAYDINGVSDAEYEMYIPAKIAGQVLFDFRHIPGMDYGATEDEIEALAEKCRRHNCEVYAISAYDTEIVNASRAVLELNPDAKYVSQKVQFGIERRRLLSELDKRHITREQFDEFMNDSCREQGLSYPLIKRFEQDLKQQKTTYKEDTMELDVILHYTNDNEAEALAEMEHEINAIEGIHVKEITVMNAERACRNAYGKEVNEEEFDAMNQESEKAWFDDYDFAMRATLETSLSEEETLSALEDAGIQIEEGREIEEDFER